MPAANFTDPRQVRFPGERRRHTTYRFDFADQHTLPETIGATAASTHLCFDSSNLGAVRGSRAPCPSGRVSGQCFATHRPAVGRAGPVVDVGVTTSIRSDSSETDRPPSGGRQRRWR